MQSMQPMQRGPRGGCYTCGGPHRQQDCRRVQWRPGGGQQQPRQQQQPGGQRLQQQQNVPRQQYGQPRVNPDANLRCLKCGRWGHRRANCRMIGE
eukprot:14624977-Heterocapsa_arctica.AAC.1